MSLMVAGPNRCGGPVAQNHEELRAARLKYFSRACGSTAAAKGSSSANFGISKTRAAAAHASTRRVWDLNMVEAERRAETGIQHQIRIEKERRVEAERIAETERQLKIQAEQEAEAARQCWAAQVEAQLLEQQERQTCSSCYGGGRVYIRVSRGEGLARGNCNKAETCPDCDGTGWI